VLIVRTCLLTNRFQWLKNIYRLSIYFFISTAVSVGLYKN